MEILIVCCTVAVIWTLLRIAENTPERLRERAERAQADREYEASVRFPDAAGGAYARAGSGRQGAGRGP